MQPQIDQDLIKYLLPEELAELDKLIAADPVPWRPLPGPQSSAYYSEAQIVGYGGAAGGGKTDLACGLSATKHRVVGIFRQTGTELTAIIDRLKELFNYPAKGYNGQEKIFRLPRYDNEQLQIELGSYPNTGDESKYQGRPHDLLIFDEAANHREKQVRFIMGWLRTTHPTQRCRVLMTFNPPTTAEGRWIIDYFAPWIDKKHPNPAEPGELRWFATIKGKDIEVDNGKHFILDENEKKVYKFNAAEYKPTDIIEPMSRTFIPSKVSDNPYLMNTNYITTLQALPEPFRSQMLDGDFTAGMQDSEWQVIPTEWVEMAMARWEPKVKKQPMDSIGVDVSRGGDDDTVISRRHGQWYDELISYPGPMCKTGNQVAGYVIAATRDQAVIHVDVIGVGSSPYDFLIEANQQAVGVNVAEKSNASDQSGRLKFPNIRSAHIWAFREMLDPSSNNEVALPDDKALLRELCAYTWKLQGSLIRVCSREELVDDLGYSPDKASAIFLAAFDTPKIEYMNELTKKHRQGEVTGHDPYANIGNNRNRGGHNSYD